METSDCTVVRSLRATSIKGAFFETTGIPTVMYRAKRWAIKKQEESNVHVVENVDTKIIMWSCKKGARSFNR